MLEAEMNHFLRYCKISEFADKSIETFTIKLNEFNTFLENTNSTSIPHISYKHLKRFVAEFKNPSAHIKKARIWTLHQFFHNREKNIMAF